MPNGWVDLKKNDALSRLNSDLNVAADPDNMGGDSIPDAGLEDAKQLCEQLPTGVDKENHRNFVVLYTDYGIESDSNERNLPVIASTLANDIGAAILVVGFGDVDGDDRAIWDSISLPKTGLVSPKHIGKQGYPGPPNRLRILSIFFRKLEFVIQLLFNRGTISSVSLKLIFVIDSVRKKERQRCSKDARYRMRYTQNTAACILQLD